ncbi:protein of unknown function DUF358 [Pyrolobus fumarii 1A]|uniref:Uncharacterized protein n=1 Tax=Pyrolobus fumarii (strain DSM 11204 / 1A) TaxID=694429 RepID=G0EFA2_PYRF1|nr:protein of unknown function DUF358 [Pyrolobus fumarii 1A]
MTGVSRSLLYKRLSSARVVWLVFSSGRAWYRGGIRGWAGSSGRLDVVARVMLAACYPGCDAQGGCLFAASLQGPALFVHEAGGRMCREYEAGEEILRGLQGVSRLSMVYPGLSGVELLSLAKSLGYRVLLLSERCPVSWRVSLNRRVVVLGADIDPPSAVHSLADECISVGPISYLASSVAALLNVLSQIDPPSEGPGIGEA